MRLRLLAGPSEKVLSFVLKENETGEVNVSTGTGRGQARTPLRGRGRGGGDHVPVVMAVHLPAVGRLHAAGAAQLPAHPAAGGGGARAPAAAPLRALPPEDAGGAGHAHTRVTAPPAPVASQHARTLARRRVGHRGGGVERGTPGPTGLLQPPWDWPREWVAPGKLSVPRECECPQVEWMSSGEQEFLGGSRALRTNKGIWVTRSGLWCVLGPGSGWEAPRGAPRAFGRRVPAHGIRR